MFRSRKVDIHSVIHFVGCYALVPTLMSMLGLSLISACLAVLLLGIWWECLDEGNSHNNWNIPFFDPRGGDYLDIIVDFGGVLLAFIVF